MVCLATVVGLGGVLLDGVDRAGQFLDRGGHLLDAGALGLGAVGQASGELSAITREPSLNWAALSVTWPMMLRQVGEHLADAGGQFVDRLVAFDLDLLGQVALGRGGDDLQKLVDLAAEYLGLGAFCFGVVAFRFGDLLLEVAFFGLEAALLPRVSSASRWRSCSRARPASRVPWPSARALLLASRRFLDLVKRLLWSIRSTG